MLLRAYLIDLFGRMSNAHKVLGEGDSGHLEPAKLATHKAGDDWTATKQFACCPLNRLLNRLFYRDDCSQQTDHCAALRG